ncbi:MAG: hypothetical protein Q8Q52_01690 [Acidimicrobiia bacterium]|nr:hypothetical protein [Acidimicrobiia bacterium]
MTESLRAHAEALAGYLNDAVLDYDKLTSADILDALASLGITLVEDPVSDSTYTYYELFTKTDETGEADD